MNRAATKAPTVLASAMRIFDLSLGQMLWSRRSVFLGLVLGAAGSSITMRRFLRV